jgi:hypothetical protein
MMTTRSGQPYKEVADVMNEDADAALQKLTKSKLLEMCRAAGIPKCSKSKLKDDLIALLKHHSQHLPSSPPLDDSSTPLNAIDLFCGCGGMSKGLTESGIHVLAGIDIWDKAVESYRSNFSHQAICADLTQLPPEEFHARYNREDKPVDI